MEKILVAMLLYIITVFLLVIITPILIAIVVRIYTIFPKALNRIKCIYEYYCAFIFYHLGGMKNDSVILEILNK